MNVVYPVKLEADNDSEELRYSLRSLKNITHRDVFIVGEKPDWIKNIIHIDIRQRHAVTRFDNSAYNIFMACCDDRVSEDFILMNDDIYITRVLEAIPTYHRGTIARVLNRDYAKSNSLYVRIMKKALRTLKENGYSTYSYELHCPMVINKKKFRDIYREVERYYNVPHGSDRTMYGNMANIGGEQIKDVKLYNPTDPIPDSEFISSSPKSWVDGGLRDYVVAKFPHKSKYEV